MTRLVHALIALLAAWLAALFVTLPFQVAVCLRNSDFHASAFWQLMPLVLGIWCIWTLALAIVGWFVLALPIALLANPRWMYRRKRILLAACLAGPIAATSLQFEVWKLLRPEPQMDKFDYALYTVFALSYAVTMAVVYLWLTGRSIRKEATGRPDGLA